MPFSHRLFNFASGGVHYATKNSRPELALRSVECSRNGSSLNVQIKRQLARLFDDDNFAWIDEAPRRVRLGTLEALDEHVAVSGACLPAAFEGLQHQHVSVLEPAVVKVALVANSVKVCHVFHGLVE